MLKLTRLNDGDRNTINIEGTVEEFKEWFLGKEKKLKTGSRDSHTAVLNGIEEIETEITLITSELNTTWSQSKSDRISNPRNTDNRKFR